MISKSIIVKGKVQGVFFRASAKRAAEDLNLNGWVKNLPDGNVEILISGDKPQIEEFIKWCHAGPENARVKEIIVNDSNEIHSNSFKIIH
ncbi:MAG: acylphosphatase [Bacteroidetes bacterium]|nr:acylphosphatase [Bacteroidota bacterium]